MAKFTRTPSYTSMANPSGVGRSALEEFKANIQPAMIKAQAASAIANQEVKRAETDDALVTQSVSSIGDAMSLQYKDADGKWKSVGETVGPYAERAVSSASDSFQRGYEGTKEGISTLAGGVAGAVASPFVGAYEGVNYVRNWMKNRRAEKSVPTSPVLTEKDFANVKALGPAGETVDESGYREALRSAGDERRGGMSPREMRKLEEKQIAETLALMTKENAKEKRKEETKNMLVESAGKVAGERARANLKKEMDANKAKKRAFFESQDPSSPNYVAPAELETKPFYQGGMTEEELKNTDMAFRIAKNRETKEYIESDAYENYDPKSDDFKNRSRLLNLMSRPSYLHGNTELSPEQSNELSEAVRNYERNLMSEVGRKIHSKKDRDKMVMKFIKKYYFNLTGRKWKDYDKKTLKESLDLREELLSKERADAEALRARFE